MKLYMEKNLPSITGDVDKRAVTLCLIKTITKTHNMSENPSSGTAINSRKKIRIVLCNRVYDLCICTYYTT